MGPNYLSGTLVVWPLSFTVPFALCLTSWMCTEHPHRDSEKLLLISDTYSLVFPLCTTLS